MADHGRQPGHRGLDRGPVVGRHRFQGEGSDEYSEVTAALGDVDGDGVDDFAIGGGYANDVYRHAGTAYVFLGGELGSSGSYSVSSADSLLVGNGTCVDCGVGVVGVGDTDGDGLDDIVVGCTHHYKARPG